MPQADNIGQNPNETVNYQNSDDQDGYVAEVLQIHESQCEKILKIIIEKDLNLLLLSVSIGRGQPDTLRTT